MHGNICGNICGVATRAGYATCLYNRPASGTASAVCNVFFYTGCTNASCTATNYAACICGANGWMYGLAGAFLPYVRANDPGSTASKTCNVVINAYCTDANCAKTTRTFTFCGSTGKMHGDVCGALSGTATNATCFGGCTYAQACTNIRSGLTSCTGTVTISNKAAANADTPIALCTGATAVGKSTGCALTFNTCTGFLTAFFFNGLACQAGHASCATCACYSCRTDSLRTGGNVLTLMNTSCRALCSSTSNVTRCVYLSDLSDSCGMTYWSDLRYLHSTTNGSSLCLKSCINTGLSCISLCFCVYCCDNAYGIVSSGIIPYGCTCKIGSVNTGGCFYVCAWADGVLNKHYPNAYLVGGESSLITSTYGLAVVID